MTCHGTIGIGGNFDSSYFLELVNAHTGKKSSFLENSGTYSSFCNTWTISSGTYKAYIHNIGFYALGANGTLTF